MDTIAAISLWNPWALLLVTGDKKVETRGWPTNHRGKLLVHAAQTWRREFGELCLDEPFRDALSRAGALTEQPGGPLGNARTITLTLPRGILGMVVVVDCVPTDDCRDCDAVNGWAFREGNWDREKAWISPTERAFGDYRPNRFAWLCKNPVRFDTPVPFRGRQQLFQVPAALIPEEHR